MEKRLSLSLFFMRITVFLVMLMWTLDKFINPGHAAKVFGHFYLMPDKGNLFFQIVGVIQLLIIFAFLIGFKKRISYGLVLALHFVSTFSSYQQYFNPWPNLLFFAAWPMLAACVALYLLRDEDNLYTLKSLTKA